MGEFKMIYGAPPPYIPSKLHGKGGGGEDPFKELGYIFLISCALSIPFVAYIGLKDRYDSRKIYHLCKDYDFGKDIIQILEQDENAIFNNDNEWLLNAICDSISRKFLSTENLRTIAKIYFMGEYVYYSKEGIPIYGVGNKIKNAILKNKGVPKDVIFDLCGKKGIEAQALIYAIDQKEWTNEELVYLGSKIKNTSVKTKVLKMQQEKSNVMQKTEKGSRDNANSIGRLKDFSAKVKSGQKPTYHNRSFSRGI